MSKYTFFWGGGTPFSNWTKAKFIYKGIQFTSSEQAMMFEKAMTFDDTEVATQILATNDVKLQKELGRAVKGYDGKVWDAIREEVVYEILLAKFGQNANLKEALFATGETTLVEASPFDNVWGIGLRETDPDIEDEANWKGLNLLGKCLTRVRETLKK
jgi:ribA/ribD-fused uncharacterized protein